MSKLLDGKRAVVTGGGRGIGLAIARALGAEGAQVVVMGRDLAVLQAAAGLISGARAVVCDVTDAESVKRAFAEAGEVDILINNAGAAGSASFERTSVELWNRMMAVNVTGAFYCTQTVLSGMQKRGYGRIVNVASTAALKGYPYVSAYCAAKHALLGLTRALAAEMAKRNITVNAVCPGYTESDLLTGSISNIMATTGRSEDEVKKMLMAGNPQGRFIQPEEVAACAVWLCSPGAESVTGQAIAIDGGEVAR
ncbi:MAG: SDR family oxidoreductase [Armatimonadetes bacterium]|nr:SDR family oxidoreductase [Armatimonadota bacterium]